MTTTWEVAHINLSGAAQLHREGGFARHAAGLQVGLELYVDD